jgi:hypothetical protein
MPINRMGMAGSAFRIGFQRSASIRGAMLSAPPPMLFRTSRTIFRPAAGIPAAHARLLEGDEVQHCQIG